MIADALPFLPRTVRTARPRLLPRAGAVVALGLCALAAAAQTAPTPRAPMLSARAWVLVDVPSGNTLAAHQAVQRHPPGDLVKLMAAYVAFLAIAEKRIALETDAQVSAAAFAAPGRDGARMYVEPQRVVTVRDLLRGMLVAGGSDAAVALAERAAGSQAEFVERMNAEARRLGLDDTRFANVTGRADAQQYTTARDLARLAQRLLADFPQHAPLFREREFAYNGITLSSRNRLLWSDPTVDGMMAAALGGGVGSMVATAVRPRGQGKDAFERRLVAVVLAAPGEATLAQEALRLLNYGFTDYDTLRLYRAGAVLSQAEVWKGDRSEVPIGVTHDVYVTLPVDALLRLGERGLRSDVERPDPLLAPLARGGPVGRLRITADGEPVGSAAVVALEGVGPAGPFGRAYDAVRLWWRRR